MTDIKSGSGGMPIPPDLIPRYALGTPGQPQPRMLQSVMAMRKPPGTVFLNGEMNHPVRGKMDIASARNGLVEDFLKAHETYGFPEPLNWLLQMDGDCVCHPMTLNRLQSWNKLAVGALCVTRYKPYQPVVYRGMCKETAPDMRSYYVQWKEVREWVRKYPALMTLSGFALLDPAPEGSLHEVDWTGSHCFLVHRSVYEAVGYPWFENATNMRFGSGSDRLFFEKVQAAGIGVYVDYSVVAAHEATTVLGMADFMAWQSISTVEEKAEEWVGDDYVTGAPEGEGEDEGSVFRGDDRKERESEPGADPEPAPLYLRPTRTAPGVDPDGLRQGDGTADET